MKPYQVTDSIIGVVRYRESDAELCQTDEKGPDGQWVNQVQVVRITSR